MKCNNCGFEHEQDFEYCVNCGAPLRNEIPAPVEPVSLNPAGDIVMGALKDKLFLVLCILMTVSCAISILSAGMPLIYILITIFLWLAYADAQKGFANEKHLQFVSGTVYANYIITNVSSIILIVCGVLFGVLVIMFGSSEEIMAEFNEAINMYGLGEYSLNYEDIPSAVMSILGVVLGAVFIFAGVIALVINILGMKKIHAFAKSVYMGIMYQKTDFQNPQAVKNWLLFFGICEILSTVFLLLSQPISAISGGCVAAATIIASVLVDKYFVAKQQNM